MISDAQHKVTNITDARHQLKLIDARITGDDDDDDDT